MRKFFRSLVGLVTVSMLAACGGKTAKVNFTGTAPAEYMKEPQPLSIYTCANGTVPHTIMWGEDNPVEIPFGKQRKGEREFFVSKYYIASPPLPNKFDADAPLILGVLSQDHFAMENNRGETEVFMDYRLLKPIQLAFIPANYNNCIEQGIDTIPINIRCPNFEYTAYGQAMTGESHGLGKGIGQLARIKAPSGELKDQGHLFIPLDIKTQTALEGCTVSIVNDILLDHLVYFGTADDHDDELDLTEAYFRYHQNQTDVELFCRARPADEPASGCVPVMPLKE